MAGSVNKVILLGNLGRDAEFVGNNQNIAKFSIATRETWKDRETGEKRESVQWTNVVVFSQPLVDLCKRFAKKGATFYVEGQLETRKWTDQGGQDRYVTEVVLRPFKGEITIVKFAEDRGGQSSGGRDYTPPPGELDDEIPF